MRKIISIALCLLTASCSLDEDPRDHIDEQEAYVTGDALFRNTVSTLYNYIGGSADGQGLQGTCRGVYDLQTFGSDEAMIPTRGNDWYDGGIWRDLYCHSWSPGHSMIKNSWLYLYKVITLCNRSLYQLDAHKHLLSVDELQAYEAEVRSIRAICYWYLLDLFARVPIITTSDVQMNDKMAQAERSELFTFLISELQEVLPLLSDANSVQRGDYYGRVTQPVVCFVLAKLILASSDPGDVVLDPFLGSGSSSVTAKKLGRHYIGIEQNEQEIINETVLQRHAGIYHGSDADLHDLDVCQRSISL